ncbi:hypothetical protein [Nocardia brasiliensis]|uniref:hypothetical protein n=1 Tax=Nocardia brasiliensis TaxID=37326 RepID=UPI002456B686|nr:hypothetical protein [Nocardia brasiliensis]
MAIETTYKTGDYVVLDHEDVPATDRGKVYTVTRVNKVTVGLTPVSAGRACLADKAMVLPATEAEVRAARAAAEAAPPLYLGSVVTLRRRDGRHVVIGLPDGNSPLFRLALLGGSPDGRYVRAERAALTLVTL